MCRVTALYHKVANVAVEDGTIVFASSGQGQEIKGSAGTGIAENLAFEITNGSVDRDRHNFVGAEIGLGGAGRNKKLSTEETKEKAVMTQLPSMIQQKS
jgi:hypothetical protein